MSEEKTAEKSANDQGSGAPAAQSAKAPAANKKAEPKGPVKEFYDAKGAESLNNVRNGGKLATVNLTNKTMVEFTKDYGQHIKKGHTQELSDVAFAIYDKAGVVKKL